nr:MAG TPA_asm: hypothetical protein [Caudoviricetes sp.]
MASDSTRSRSDFSDTFRPWALTVATTDATHVATTHETMSVMTMAASDSTLGPPFLSLSAPSCGRREIEPRRRYTQ